MNKLSPNELGMIGENRIYNIVKGFNFWFKGGKVLRNLYLQKENGETTEIDMIYITKKGIFVFESKNYSGIVKGSKDDLKWIVEYKNGNIYEFYNPIKQNETHIRYLRNIIGLDIPIFSVIIFSSQATLYLPESYNFNLYTIPLYKLKIKLKEIWKRSRNMVTRKTIKNIYNNLYMTTQISDEIKKKHIENIKRYNEDINTDFSDLNPKLNTLNHIDYDKKGDIIEDNRKVCPLCGKGLVLKTATKGANQGSQFYGCMGWPNCKYTENIYSSNKKKSCRNVRKRF